MQSQAFIDRLMADISRHLPGDLGRLRQDVEHSVRAVLNETLTRLDLVSREEFEVQRQVLERTRAKLDALEKEVAALERATGEDDTP
ncbi:accessory factor UbiK family protein [Alloalcanivorax profundimaris]|uniref:accessory factor UbiK family protein n=1 Tax=Alloalcanivorax profundimaris TaxID=2735259 RepID=UPI0018880C6B|nr:accessory factor UbiK family protein [Alloalcanivorax profundimaris]MBF1803039.1 accessory factor UbiK family protein [Alloalcanivorax profundimaris]|tara:strand:- start:12 stop:272 length:261 start_codon:yes stop_codon:yes gene_type:complete